MYALQHNRSRESERGFFFVAVTPCCSGARPRHLLPRFVPRIRRGRTGKVVGMTWPRRIAAPDSIGGTCRSAGRCMEAIELVPMEAVEGSFEIVKYNGIG